MDRVATASGLCPELVNRRLDTLFYVFDGVERLFIAVRFLHLDAVNCPVAEPLDIQPRVATRHLQSSSVAIVSQYYAYRLKGASASTGYLPLATMKGITEPRTLLAKLGVCPSNRSAKLLVGKFSRISGHGEDLS